MTFSKNQTKPILGLKKAEALKEEGLIFGHSDFGGRITPWGYYGICQDHQALLDLIKSKKRPYYAEYIPGNEPICPFFDIDGKKTDMTSAKEEIYELKSRLDDFFSDYVRNYVVLTASTESIFSAHVILRLSKITNDTNATQGGEQKLVVTDFYLKNMNDMRFLYKKLNLTDLSTVDKNVYRAGGGLYRSIYSLKPNDTLDRPFIPDFTIYDSSFDDIESFVCYIPSPEKIRYVILDDEICENPVEITEKTCEDIGENKKTNILTGLGRKIQGVHKGFSFLKSYEPKKMTKGEGYLVEYDGKCPITGTLHKSNKNRLIITPHLIKFRCFSSNCEKRKTKTPPLKTKKILTQDEYKILFNDGKTQDIQEIDDISIKQDIALFAKDHTGATVSPSDIMRDGNGYKFRSLAHSPVLQDLMQEGSDHRINDLLYTLAPVGNKNSFSYVIDSYTESKLRTNVIQVLNVTQNIITNNFYDEKGKRQKIKDDLNIIDRIPPARMGLYVHNNEYRTEMKEALFNMTHLSVFDFFNVFSIFEHGETLIFLPDEKSYYVWTGSVWKKDPMMIHAVRHISVIVKGVLVATKKALIELKLGHEEVNWFFDALTKKLEDNHFLQEVLKIGRGVLSKDESPFDKNKDLIPFKNGVYSITKMSFGYHQQNHYITQHLSYDYDESVRCPALDEYLHNLFPNDEHKDYVLSVCASVLDENVTNDALYFLVGKSGSNGKSLFLNLLNLTYGHYATTLRPGLLTNSKASADQGNSVTPSLMALKNKRLAFVSEPSKGLMDTSVIKRFCGQDYVAGRQLYQEETQFKIKAKFFIACNTVPTFTDYDLAIIRRLNFIEFKSRFVEEPCSSNEVKRDPLMHTKINEDIAMRQAFMLKILPFIGSSMCQPKEFSFLKENIIDHHVSFLIYLKKVIILDLNSFLSFKEIIAAYYDYESITPPDQHSKTYRKLLKQFKDYIDMINPNNGSVKNGVFFINGIRIRTWKGLKFINLS